MTANILNAVAILAELAGKKLPELNPRRFIFGSIGLIFLSMFFPDINPPLRYVIWFIYRAVNGVRWKPIQELSKKSIPCNTLYRALIEELSGSFRKPTLN